MTTQVVNVDHTGDSSVNSPSDFDTALTAPLADHLSDVAGPLGGVTFTSRTEAIQRVIIDPIEASGEVADARVEFDIDAIAAEVLGDHEQGYASLVDVDEFWRTVKRHARNDFPGGAL